MSKTNEPVYKTLDQCLGINLPTTDLKPSVISRYGVNISAHNIKRAKETFEPFINTIVHGSVIRPLRRLGKRKPRMSRISDEQIVQMNILYEQGERVLNIAHSFELSYTYCNNLICRYRADNKMAYLSKSDRGTTVTNTMNRPNVDKIKRDNMKKHTNGRSNSGYY